MASASVKTQMFALLQEAMKVSTGGGISADDEASRRLHMDKVAKIPTVVRWWWCGVVW